MRKKGNSQFTHMNSQISITLANVVKKEAPFFRIPPRVLRLILVPDGIFGYGTYVTLLD